MNQRMLAELGRSQRLAILNALKRSQGMSVREIAAALKMSYMGIKDLCTEMEKMGYLDRWRRRVPKGRPEVLYRLTKRSHELFPSTSNAATIELLEAARTLFGPSGPEKLLYQWSLQRTQHYTTKLKGDTLLQKIQSLARIRDQEGHMTTVEQSNGTVAIVEHHSPVLDLLRAFPLMARLEEDLFRRVLKVEVIREEENSSALYCCWFRIPAVQVNYC